MKRDLKRTKPAIYLDRYVLLCIFYYRAHILVWNVLFETNYLLFYVYETRPENLKSQI